jgi:glutamate dehydrogenase
VPQYDVTALEAAVAATTRTWRDELSAALATVYGAGQGSVYSRLYGDAFPTSYVENHGAMEAALHIRHLETTISSRRLHLDLYRDPGMSDQQLMLKLMNPEVVIPLSTVLPIFENMGLFVDSERPYEIRRDDAESIWVHDFGMRYTRKGIPKLAGIREPFQEVVDRIWHGGLENDGLNELVLCADLKAREITLLRAYARYLRQIGTAFSQKYIQDSLVNNARIARLLVDLFLSRFNPEFSIRQGRRIGRLKSSINAQLDAVQSLDEDRILRRIYTLVNATVRTNYFQHDAHGNPKDHLALKFAPRLIPDLPQPYPEFEIFVYSPRVEGVHLRGGKVARGGIRWSDRREDFRTEVLGLMKAQMVKNAVIVPMGAKGGFYVKQPPVGDVDLLQREGIDCYKIFIRGLLDLTDNQIDDRIIPPANVVRYDDDDPYLVVAADKGTATFSDIANAVAAEYGFWLGDAFASGGSAGYDHKKMAITARGAWESVRHHFQVLGSDTQSSPFTAVGIGDMSGDVFGNGMLLSPYLKLVGAFNHAHVFLDPDPDPNTGFSERRRLFELPGSSWADYDRSLVSNGGGVFLRSAKSVPLSPEIRTVLGTEQESVSPDELIRLLLMAPVDLLWNGGIGTYIKHDEELHTEVGDKANDNVRINSSQLRCRVIAEGGNLGVTQRGRIGFEEQGHRINADWIDNSGGVDCSDREVNIKVLLNALTRTGALSLKQRNRLLQRMTNDIAAQVLQDNYRQVRAISIAEIETRTHLGWYGLLITKLEKREGFSRRSHWLPTRETLDERRATGQGLYRAEVAALLAHTKTTLYTEILDSTLPDDPYLIGMLMRYFPKPLQQKYEGAIHKHPLRREIIATVVTNSMVNRAGMPFGSRLVDETGMSVADVTKAYLVGRDIFNINGLWTEIDKLDYKVSVETQALLVFEFQYLLRHATRWFLRHNDYLEDIAETVESFRPCVVALKGGKHPPCSVPA